MLHSELLRKVVREIEFTFPMAYVEVETVAESDEVFVVVDSMVVYDSPAYQAVVARLKGELLWPSGVFNVFFGVSDAGRRFANVALSIHASYSYTAFSLDSEVDDRQLAPWARMDLSTAA